MSVRWRRLRGCQERLLQPPRVTQLAEFLAARAVWAHSVASIEASRGQLERGLRRFPIKKLSDVLDAAYWSWTDLANPSALMSVIGQPVDFAHSTGIRDLPSKPMTAYQQHRPGEWQRR